MILVPIQGSPNSRSYVEKNLSLVFVRIFLRLTDDPVIAPNFVRVLVLSRACDEFVSELEILIARGEN